MGGPVVVKMGASRCGIELCYTRSGQDGRTRSREIGRRFVALGGRPQLMAGHWWEVVQRHTHKMWKQMHHLRDVLGDHHV